MPPPPATHPGLSFAEDLSRHPRLARPAVHGKSAAVHRELEPYWCLCWPRPAHLRLRWSRPAHLRLRWSCPAHLRWSRPARLRRRWFRPVPRYPERPQVPLGLLGNYEGMVWSPAPEPAPRQRPPVPTPRQRPLVPAPRQRPPVPTPRKCSQVPPLVLPSSSSSPLVPSSPSEHPRE